LAGSAFTEMLGIGHGFNDANSVAENPGGLDECIAALAA